MNEDPQISKVHSLTLANAVGLRKGWLLGCFTELRCERCLLLEQREAISQGVGAMKMNLGEFWIGAQQGVDEETFGNGWLELIRVEPFPD